MAVISIPSRASTSWKIKYQIKGCLFFLFKGVVPCPDHCNFDHPVVNVKDGDCYLSMSSVEKDNEVEFCYFIGSLNRRLGPCSSSDVEYVITKYGCICDYKECVCN